MTSNTDKVILEDNKTVYTDAEAALFMDFRDGEDLEYDENQCLVETAVKATDTPIVAIDCKLIDFGDILLQQTKNANTTRTATTETFDSIYSFISSASSDLLKQMLDSFINSEDVAEAIHRLRIISGVSGIDTRLDYNYYYMFSYCTDADYDTSDWEHIFSTSMSEIVEEIFMGDIYMSGSHEITVVLLPANMSEYELEFVRAFPERICGFTSDVNVLAELDCFLQICPTLDAEGQELQLSMMEEFMKLHAPKFPDLKHMRVTDISKQEECLNGFKLINEQINKFLHPLIDNESEHQAETLLPFAHTVIDDVPNFADVSPDNNCNS